jgi:hypothetical protein
VNCNMYTFKTDGGGGVHTLVPSRCQYLECPSNGKCDLTYSAA